MADPEEPRETAALGFIRIDREGGMTAPARMSDVIGAATDAVVIPGVHDVKDERMVDTDGWVQTSGRLPRPVADTRNVFTIDAGGVEWKSHPGNRDDVTPIDQTAKLHLETLDG